MPKKFGQNTKAVEARERKEVVKQTKNTATAKAKEDAKWADDDPKGLKAAARKKLEEEKKQQAAARRLEKKALEDKEAAELAKLGKPKQTSKVTRSAIDKEKEKIVKEDKAKVQAASASKDRLVPLTSSSSSTAIDSDEEWDAGLEKNINHLIREERARHGNNLIEARSVEEALSGLSVEGDGQDKHPEKRLKAAFIAYEQANLPLLRQENPGMKLSQYKEMLWKQWQKAPENPLNAIRQS
jgi:hypothetical protein